MIHRHRTAGAALLLALLLAAVSATAAEQYKKKHRECVSLMVDGQFDKALRLLHKDLREHPGDPETHFCLAIAHAQGGDMDKAMENVRFALEAGLPFGRFVAGPRELLQPLVQSTEFKALAAEHTESMIHGPVLGRVTDSGAAFWIRTAHAASARVSVSASEAMKPAVQSKDARTEEDSDFTAVLGVNDLKPDTRYYYTITLDGREAPGKWSFRTCPPARSKARFQAAFGGGAGYTPVHERMWNVLASYELAAFLFLGDNVYIDNPTRSAVQRYCYYRRQSRPEYRKFAAATALYAIWDDHDFTTNDRWGGPLVGEPEWKTPVWEVFRQNWINPAYGGGRDRPGCWFSFSIADVDFFMLDGRYYRTDPRKPNQSMLGPEQKRWLFDRLSESKASFKVLASPVPWSAGTKPGSLDTWDGYAREREEILSFLETNRVDGVILISADRHRSDVRQTKRPGGYALYEFESSKLTNIHTHRLMPGALFGYNEKCSFGLFCFDTTKPDPEVTFKIVNIDNEVVYELTLKRSALSRR